MAIKLIKFIYLAGMFALVIYLTKQLIITLESVDDIDAPADYALNGDQADLNEVIP